jgi:antitoxin (DNA-binding transcriptional repressor) of toxin-antitoxin stability system
MKSMTATEASRGFSRLLDSLENGGEEVVILRNNHPVARLVPGASRMTALEALGDIYATLDDTEGEAWLRDARESSGLLAAERRDPWA